MRKAEISRNTKETRVSVSLDLSGGELQKAAYNLMKEAPINFVGNI